LPSVNASQGATVRTQARRLVPALLGVVALYFLAMFVGRPVLMHWREVDAPLQASQLQVAQVQALIQNHSAIDSAVQRHEQELARQSQRVLRARSRSLAASALQSLVLELAESSNVTITRLDVAQPDSTGDLPFDLSANGDIYGLADLLQRIRTARFVMVVRKLQVQNNSALRGAPDVLQIALSLQAPVIVQ
jgi:hypothetical protein